MRRVGTSLCMEARIEYLASSMKCWHRSVYMLLCDCRHVEDSVTAGEKRGEGDMNVVSSSRTRRARRRIPRRKLPSSSAQSASADGTIHEANRRREPQFCRCTETVARPRNSSCPHNSQAHSCAHRWPRRRTRSPRDVELHAQRKEAEERPA